MNKDIIEMQRGCNATCVVILDEYHQKLDNSLIVDSGIEDYQLYSGKLGNPIFKETLETLSNNQELSYLIIRNIDTIEEDKQDRYVGLVKDRYFHGYEIPLNIIIVFTLSNKNNITKISRELYHYSVITI